MRPKPEIRLLVEFAFRMLWGFGNTLQINFKHLPDDDHHNLAFYLGDLLNANLFTMHPEGNTRMHSHDPITIKTLEVFSLEYNAFTQKHTELKQAGYPHVLFTTKVELEAAHRVDRITDRICEIYENQYQAL